MLDGGYIYRSMSATSGLNIAAVTRGTRCMHCTYPCGEAGISLQAQSRSAWISARLFWDTVRNQKAHQQFRQSKEILEAFERTVTGFAGVVNRRPTVVLIFAVRCDTPTVQTMCHGHVNAPHHFFDV